MRMARPSSNFYPRPPRGGRLEPMNISEMVILFLSTPSARRATQQSTRNGKRMIISIHALREEGDVLQSGFSCLYQRFLSTPSARRATDPSAIAEHGKDNFYPRPPRGGRHAPHYSLQISDRFLSTPSARRATYFLVIFKPGKEFLSTPSARRATPGLSVAGNAKDISIHALREEGDVQRQHVYEELRNFYPRPPRGGRLFCVGSTMPPYLFLSTPSARRATFLRLSRGLSGGNFYPRPPRGGRRRATAVVRPRGRISIHALREEGDFHAGKYLDRLFNFYPRPPRGGRHEFLDQRRSLFDFYPRPPRGGRLFEKKVLSDFALFLSTPSARRATNRAQAIRTAK